MARDKFGGFAPVGRAGVSGAWSKVTRHSVQDTQTYDDRQWSETADGVEWRRMDAVNASSEMSRFVERVERGDAETGWHAHCLEWDVSRA